MIRTSRLAAALGAASGLALAAPAAAQDTIVMQSIYASSLPLLGDSGTAIGPRISAVTGGEIEIEFNEPGAIVGGNEIWDAVSTGAVDAGWYSPGFAQGIIPAAGIFTAVPFGPDVREYTAWWYNGGGRELWAEITEPYGVHSELCAILAPEASGWFREPIESVEDLAGAKMRIFGLGAAVMQKLGVAAQSLPPADTMTGLRLGTIDAAEISFPAIDLRLGMQEHASHYYFPGCHQQTSLITFIINQDRWDGLEERHRAAIREVCAANVALTTAQGESIQLEPLAELVAQGVTVHRWSDEMLDAFRGAWEEVVAEQSAADADFKRAWEHLSAFREKYAQWAALGYLD
jgi:TRAP-type mannitol/chloroaromatic compound transport system substrate-binding protein